MISWIATDDGKLDNTHLVSTVSEAISLIDLLETDHIMLRFLKFVPWGFQILSGSTSLPSNYGNLMLKFHPLISPSLKSRNGRGRALPQPHSCRRPYNSTCCATGAFAAKLPVCSTLTDLIASAFVKTTIVEATTSCTGRTAFVTKRSPAANVDQKLLTLKWSLFKTNSLDPEEPRLPNHYLLPNQGHVWLGRH